MLVLPHIFSSGALFQQNTTLTVSGLSDAGITVSAELTDAAGAVITEVQTTAASDGTFAMSLQTPDASMISYTLTISAGDERHVMEDVLFGELWLASGQSNMELQNECQLDAAPFFETLNGCVIRAYHVYNIEGGSSGMFPAVPDPMAFGEWFSITDPNSPAKLSAIGTSFAKTVYDMLRTCGRDTPVGFVNACWGGTGIRSWIPRADIDRDAALCRRLREAGFYTDPAKWNSFGHSNAQQLSCQYNLKIHGLLGVKFRGMLWYQGEYESWDEPMLRLYRDCLSLLHRVYKSLFSAGEHFPMLCVLIYPFPCTDEGDCYIGYVNQNFVDAAKASPDEFHFMPIYDLPPVWDFPGNHPIHPLNKYPIGQRLGRLAGAVVYGQDGQSNPAVLDHFVHDGSRLVLHFSVPGQPDALRRFGGIRIGQALQTDEMRQVRPIGLYLCGTSGVYVPAVCEILSHDTIALTHPGISRPLHAVYAYSSMEEGCNLWAGAYPLGSFRTDDRPYDPQDPASLITIECKPWCDPTRTSVWCDSGCPGVTDVFYRPVWHPSDHSEVSHDRAFTLDSGSIRIAQIPDHKASLPHDAVIGAYVESYLYNRLDLQSYASLRLRMLCAARVTLSLVLTVQHADGSMETITLTAEKTSELHHRWADYEICLNGLPSGEIIRMEFRASLDEAYYHFVNLEGFVLVPRGECET